MASLDWKYPVLDVPDAGLAIDRVATPAERESFAKDLEVLGVDRLVLNGRVRAAGEGRYHLTGQLGARVAQACVVTLDPVPEEVSVALDIDFVPPHLMPPPIPEADESDEDAPQSQLCEPIMNGVLDLGELVFQEVAANLDPYPRLPDANLDKTEAGPGDGATTNPFAKLKDLKVTKDQG